MSRAEEIEAALCSLMERAYCYKLVSLALNPELTEHQLNALNKAIEEVFPDQWPHRLHKLYRLVAKSAKPEVRTRLAAQLGEMKALEPLERLLVPQVTIGTTLADLHGFYSAFSLNHRGPLPSDHLAVEAEFMAHLLLREAYAKASGNQEMEAVVRDAQMKFLRDHLGRCLGFLKALEARVSAARPLMKECQAFLEEELAGFGLKPQLLGVRGDVSKGCVSCPYA